jgi:hypothetical protein
MLTILLFCIVILLVFLAGIALLIAIQYARGYYIREDGSWWKDD